MNGFKNTLEELKNILKIPGYNHEVYFCHYSENRSMWFYYLKDEEFLELVVDKILSENMVPYSFEFYIQDLLIESEKYGNFCLKRLKEKLPNDYYHLLYYDGTYKKYGVHMCLERIKNDLNELRNRELKGAEDFLKTGNASFKITDMRLINFIVENGMYNYINLINIKDEINESVEDFIIRGLKENSSICPMYLTPRIIDAVVENGNFENLMTILADFDYHYPVLNIDYIWKNDTEYFKKFIIEVFLKKAKQYEIFNFMYHNINTLKDEIYCILENMPEDYYFGIIHSSFVVSDCEYIIDSISKIVKIRGITSIVCERKMIKFCELPRFLNKIPENLAIAIINGLVKKDLEHEYPIQLQYLTNNRKLLEALILKICEFSLVKYRISIRDVGPYLTPQCIKTIFSKKNPLDLDYDELVYFFGNPIYDNKYAIYKLLYENEPDLLFRGSNPLLIFSGLLFRNDIYLLERMINNEKFKPFISKSFEVYYSKMSRASVSVQILMKKYYLSIKNIPLYLSYEIGGDIYSEATTFDCPNEEYLFNYNRFKISTSRRTPFSNEKMASMLIKHSIFNITNGCKVSLYLLWYGFSISKSKYYNIKNFIYNENVEIIMDKETMSILPDLIDSFPDFYEQRIVPKINANYILNENVPYDYFFDSLISAHINKYTELYNENPNIRFDMRILSFLSNTNNDLQLKVDNFLKLVQNNIDERYIEYAFQFDYHPIAREIILKKIIKNVDLYPYIAEKCIHLMNSEFYDTLEIELERLPKDFVNDFFKKMLENELFLSSNQERSVLLLKKYRIKIKPWHIKSSFVNSFFIETISSYDYNIINDLIIYISHAEHKIFNYDGVRTLLKIYANANGLNQDNVLYLHEKFGIEIVSLLNNENFQMIVNLNEGEFERFLNLIKIRKLNLDDIYAIRDSLQQHVFSYKNQNVLSLFSDIKDKLRLGISASEVEKYIGMLSLTIPKNMRDILIKNNCPELIQSCNSSNYDFLKELFYCLLTTEKKYLDVLHAITNNYILEARNLYASKNSDIYDTTYLTYKFDERSLADRIFAYLFKNNFSEIINFVKNISTNHKRKIKKIAGIHDILPLLDTNDVEETIKNNSHYLKIIKNIFRECSTYLSDIPSFYQITNNKDFCNNVKRIPIIKSRKSSLTEMLASMQIETIIENIIRSEEKYKYLNSILDKYKFLDWEDIFTPLLCELSINEYINMYDFINAFSSIYELEKISKRRHFDEGLNENIKFTPFSVVKYASCYSSVENYYKIVLGLEDSNLINANSGHNAANADRRERLDLATSYQIKMCEFRTITIPSFIYEYETKTKNILMAIVGNRIDPRNLTHGERTDACMRAYGIAEELYNFCLLDEHGFHITFVDKNTNSYVSRISGFRNGNAVILNQLRYSCSLLYNNDDIVEALTNVANELIRLSKNSKMPIEIIIADNSYALENHETHKINSSYCLGHGIYDGYIDTMSNAVVIASSLDEDKLSITHMGDVQPIYESVRLPYIEYAGEKIDLETIFKMQRITALRMCIENKDNPYFYKTLDIDENIFKLDLERVILGEDYFVAMDKYGNIYRDQITSYEKTTEEVKLAIEQIKNYRNNSFIKKY